MPELKRNFTGGRMNKDIDERMVPKGEYVDALNIEVRTSEGSNVGTVQTLKGNTAITNLFNNATCVGTVAKNNTNKIYWLVSDLGKNTNASTTLSQAEQDSTGTVSVVHDVYSDYIMEYDENTGQANYIVVENYKVTTTITNDNHGTNDHLHISNLSSATTGDIRKTGVQPGMDVFINNMKTSIIKIEADDTSTYYGWRIYTEHTSSDTGYANLANVKAGDTVTFELPSTKTALGFSHFATTKPKKLITGINVIDDLLFFTDGLTEPKKINIERCRFGSQQGLPATYPNGTNIYNTLLFVNGRLPASNNGRVGNYDSTSYASVGNVVIPYLPLTYRETTVIKKSPTTPLILTMSNFETPFDQDALADGIISINSIVNLPPGTGGSGTATNALSSDFFFNSNGEPLSHGDLTPDLTFPRVMDWKEGSIVEFYPEDSDAGSLNDVLVVAMVDTITNSGQTFKFEIQSISTSVAKPFTSYYVALKQGNPLFELKFPRFAYRWKYEDGEYSTYSPFSEVAFIPERFDYMPKKGFNLGMTNNLRYLVLSGFKPKTTPVDVVEIDILYKESNSPNVYTVETIKSPSSKVDSLNTFNYNGDPSWFGKIESESTFAEAPNTLTTSVYTVGNKNFTGDSQVISGTTFYALGPAGVSSLDQESIRIGDKITFLSGQTHTAFTGDLIVTGFNYVTLNPIVINNPFGGNITIAGSGGTHLAISFTAGGTAVTDTAITWLFNNSDFQLSRTLARRPALYVDDPQGSLKIKTDMIHATLPSNQLLRPYDNVPVSALAQEITSNRIVYGNYIQNYDLEDSIPKINIRTGKRKNVPDNIQYNPNTELRDRITGETILWYDNRNSIVEVPTSPERSLKSLRDYQVGVVYMDEFGRQTPVLTHENATLRIPKYLSDNYNAFQFRISSSIHPSITVGANPPVWATHYKYYIKENANEYYNMAMDRFYDAEDGNIWLSFSSSERNKVDEETFLTLKKEHENDFAVTEEFKYKILAIANEAPLFVKTKLDTHGRVTTTFDTAGQPKFQASHVDVPSTLFGSGAVFGDLPTANRVLRISNNQSQSKLYDIAGINGIGNNVTRITLRKQFGTDMSFTTTDGTNAGNLISTSFFLEISTREIKNLAEFAGRFFVKILRDALLEKYVINKNPQKSYVTSHVVALGKMGNISASKSKWKATNVPHREFWVSQEEPQAEYGTPSLNLNLITGGVISKDFYEDDFPMGSTTPSTGLAKPLKLFHGPSSGPLSGKITSVDLLITHGNSTGGDGHFITHSNNTFSAPAEQLKEAQSFRKTGQLFRWKGDTTIYRVKDNGKERPFRNYKTNNTDMYNQSVAITMNFEPALGDTDGIYDASGNATGLDAAGQPVTGYDPRKGDKEQANSSNTFGTDGGNTWPTLSDGDLKDNEEIAFNASQKRTIEFLDELVVDDTFMSDNPAIWETEPKENIDLDIYNEASEAIPISLEWNSYTNKFIKYTDFNSWNAVKYYNCFSFANGVESNRLRDDFNAVTIDKGPRVSTVLAQQYKQEHRKSGLIYSGIYNSTGGINNLNQFIQAEKITKDLSPTYGSVQKLHAKDTNLTVLCEDRVLRILADKDALFNADGNTNVTATDRFLGQAMPYSGNFGISSNPESFASDQYRSYFTDKQRGAVLRLSKDGLTPISDVGMADYFKDTLASSNIALSGSYDDSKKLYSLTLKEGNAGTTIDYTEATASFSESSKGWTTFQSYLQETGVSLNNKYFTFKAGDIYQHYNNDTRNKFYSVDYDSTICVTFNDLPSSIKNFGSLSYEGSQARIVANTTDQEYYNQVAVDGWYAESISTDLETGFVPEFKEKEGKWFNYIRGNKDNTLENLDVRQFSTQGIGTPSAVETPAALVNPFTLTIKDTGDTD
tara:strand:- start:3841 stop:9480 length:5640 start_codon:yes stop_codon:yes gene_type:complete